MSELDIINKNLSVANKILDLIKERPSPDGKTSTSNHKLSFISPSVVPEPSDLVMPGFSSEEELGGVFLTLQRREAVIFSNAKDLDDPWNKIMFFDIEPNKKKLAEFVKIANDKIFGVSLRNKADIKSNLAILHILTRNLKNSVEIKPDFFIVKQNEVGINDFSIIPGAIEYLEWMADYSGIIKINNELEADFDYADGKAYPMGATYEPKSVTIVNQEKLNDLFNQIKTMVSDSYAKRINLLLGNKKEIGWRCVKCGRYLNNLNGDSRIANLLIDFVIKNYKTCHTCRTKNYFTMNKVGDIKFMSSKETFKDVVKIPRSIKSKIRKKQMRKKKAGR